MTRFRRWCVVALGTVLVIGVPVVLRSLPAAQSDVGATRLVAMVKASQAHGWSGFVDTEGTLALPSATNFDDVASLFGESTQLRVWWQGRDRWRVDRLLTTGETDLIHRDATTIEYDFEHAEASISTDPSIRLPRTADLVPPELARRALADADVAHAVRIPARRVAGISAPGLRVTPRSTESSVDHVDLWADPTTGVPLRVEVFADPHGSPSFTTSFRDFDGGRPSDDAVSYQATSDTDVKRDNVLDIADAANQYAPVVPPATADGLAQSSASDGAVGVYGSGLTELIAIPLRDREADALRKQLALTPGVVQTDGTTAIQVGILGVILTGKAGDGGWLLGGTLNQAALARAAADVVSGFHYTDRR